MKINYVEVEKKIKKLNKKIENLKKGSWGLTLLSTFVLSILFSFIRDEILKTAYQPDSTLIFLTWFFWFLFSISPITRKLKNDSMLNKLSEEKKNLESKLIFNQTKQIRNNSDKTLKDKLIELLELKEEGMLSKEEYEKKRKDIISKYE